MMCVVHDLAEAHGECRFQVGPRNGTLTPPCVGVCPVGDITPREGIFKEEKRRRESVRPNPPTSY